MKLSGSRRGGILRGLLFSIVAIVALIVAGVAFVAQKVNVTTRKSASGDDVSIQTPGGEIKIRTRDHASELPPGIPIYPGAVRTKDAGGASFQWNSDDGKSDKGFAVSGAELITPDAAEKVLIYYRQQLADWIPSVSHDGSTLFKRREGRYQRFVSVNQKSDGTHIGVASVGEPASN